MSALTTAIQNQEYACDAATLNSRTETKRKRIYRSSDDGGSYTVRSYRTQAYIPKFCQDLYNHEFTEYNQIKQPKYVCNADKWYSQTDWERGYTQEIVSRKWNRYTESYDYTYKKYQSKKTAGSSYDNIRHYFRFIHIYKYLIEHNRYFIRTNLF